VARNNPPAIPADTTPEVWWRQMDAIAARPVRERAAESAALNRAVADMQADAIRRRHPDYTERQVFLALVKQRYGAELAEAAWPECRSVSP
jgi:hypothetical protein